MVLLGWVRQTPHVHGTSKGDMISDLEICRTAASSRRDRADHTAGCNTETRARRARGLKMHCHCDGDREFETVLKTLKVGTALRLVQLGTVDLSRSEQKLGRQLQAAHLLSLGAVGFRTSLVSKLLVNICTELEQVREKRGPLMAKGPGFIECTR
jgi:hypothetical protein